MQALKLEFVCFVDVQFRELFAFITHSRAHSLFLSLSLLLFIGSPTAAPPSPAQSLPAVLDSDDAESIDLSQTMPAVSSTSTSNLRHQTSIKVSLICLSLCLPLSLSLAHIHTHTHSLTHLLKHFLTLSTPISCTMSTPLTVSSFPCH